MRYTFISLFISTVILGNSFAFLNAQGQPQTQEQTGQTEQAEGEQGFALTDKPLEIWTFIDDYRVITGRTLHLTVQLIWKLGITVNVGEIDKLNFHPLRVEGVTIGERQIFDNEHDYMVITYTLSLPSDMNDGVYSVPSFSLSYTNEVDKTEGKTASSPVAIKKVPILVEGKVDRDVVTIGDRINYALTIRHEKKVKLLWETIDKHNFSPFEVLKRDIEKQTEGNIEKTLINYTLSLYELSGKKKTPEIHGPTILYYVESKSKPNEAKADNSLIDTKEVKVEPVPIILNSLLKAVDVPLEGLKGPMYYSKKDIFLKGYLLMGFGAVLLLFLGVITLRSVSGKLSTVLPMTVSETPQIALGRLRNITASFQFAKEDLTNRENICKIDKALRTYLGALIGISNETAQSATTSGFLNHDTQKQLSAEILTTIKNVLKQLDNIIYGRHIRKESVDKMMQGIEEIIKQTGSMFVKH